MNLYVPKTARGKIVEKIKEMAIVDEYSLDSERLGKEKIKLHSRASAKELAQALVPILPADSMMVDQTEYPGAEYVLCVGEMEPGRVDLFDQHYFVLSILTVKETHIRFNAWVPLAQLSTVFEERAIQNLSSINGKIKAVTLFVMEAKEGALDALHESVSRCTNTFLIKENILYVKLRMPDFSALYHTIQPLCHKIDIADEDNI